MDAETLQQDALKLKQYEKLGPFEIKDFLAKVATKSAEEASLTYLNAGRGNPNWVATEPREAFFLLGQFAVTESKRVLDLPPGVGGMPKAPGIAGRLEAWLTKHADMPGAPFLQRMVPWTVKKFAFDVFRAALARKSLISNGLRLSYARRVTTSIDPS